MHRTFGHADAAKTAQTLGFVDKVTVYYDVLRSRWTTEHPWAFFVTPEFTPSPDDKTAGVAGDVSGKAGGTARRVVLGIGVDQETEGLRVSRVNPGSIAERIQLQPADRIVSVNGHRVMSSDELASRLNEVAENDGQAAIVINRNGQTRTVNHTFERAAAGTATSTIARARLATVNLAKGGRRSDSGRGGRRAARSGRSVTPDR